MLYILLAIALLGGFIIFKLAVGVIRFVLLLVLILILAGVFFAGGNTATVTTEPVTPVQTTAP